MPNRWNYRRVICILSESSAYIFYINWYARCAQYSFDFVCSFIFIIFILLARLHWLAVKMPERERIVVKSFSIWNLADTWNGNIHSSSFRVLSSCFYAACDHLASARTFHLRALTSRRTDVTFVSLSIFPLVLLSLWLLLLLFVNSTLTQIIRNILHTHLYCRGKESKATTMMKRIQMEVLNATIIIRLAC